MKIKNFVAILLITSIKAKAIQFEWDENKNAKNIKKHGLDFSRAIAVFDDPNRLEEDSTKPEYNEVRIKTIGKVDALVFVLTVVYTNRDEKRRIISARCANKAERQKYNESLIKTGNSHAFLFKGHFEGI